MFPKISLVAFQDRQNHFIFVAVPNENGRYLRTDKSVAYTRCEMCKSTVGEPCKSSTGKYTGSTHYVRRRDIPRLHVFDDIVGELNENSITWRITD
jgi:hypothetical protein